MCASAWLEMLGVELGVKRMNIVLHGVWDTGIDLVYDAVHLYFKRPVGFGYDWEGQNEGCNCTDGVCQSLNLTESSCLNEQVTNITTEYTFPTILPAERRQLDSSPEYAFFRGSPAKDKTKWIPCFLASPALCPEF